MTQNFTPSFIRRMLTEHKPNMELIYVGLLVLMCAVIQIKSERTRSVCQGCHREEYRIKRAKYYSNPPIRFYNKPPIIYPIKGPFSYTPPPRWIEDDRQPQSSRPKVSGNQHTNDGLGDEDISNIMKFVSKQDLDKIVEFANEKWRESPLYKPETVDESPNYIINKREKHDSKVMFNDNDSVSIGGNKFAQYEHFIGAQQGFRPYSTEYSNPKINELKDDKLLNFSDLGPSAQYINKNRILDSDRSMQTQQLSSPYEGASGISNGAAIFTDSSLMQEEQLPRPTNLREEDFELSFTNIVPTIIKANSNSYKIENLGMLPLMNYHSKLESVDSYKVPHYTVTSPEGHRAPTSIIHIPVEPAPSVSTAQEQSDAHLKAIKIWTHKSRGTAYTLHDDGTLSLEIPS